MQQRTSEQQKVGQRAERVPPMLAQDIECAHDGERGGGDDDGTIQGRLVHGLKLRSRSTLPTTLTDDKAIAAAAMMGESSRPKAG